MSTSVCWEPTCIHEEWDSHPPNTTETGSNGSVDHLARKGFSLVASFIDVNEIVDFLILFFYCRPLGERNLSKSLDVISLGSIEREKIINIRSCKSFFVLPHITASQPKLSSSFRQLLPGVSIILYKLQCCFGGEGGLKLNKRNKSGNFYCNRTTYSMSTKDWGITEEAVARVNTIPYKSNVVDCVSGFIWFALKFS